MDTKYAAQAKYDKNHTKSITLKLNLTTDADIIAWLGTTQSKQGAVKDAIRQVLKKRGK